MAQGGAKDLFTKLADAGEDAIQRFGEMPGVGKLAEPMLALKHRVDDLQRRVRGLDALERRMTEVEQRLNALAPKPLDPGPAESAAPPSADAPPTAERAAGNPDG